MGEGVGAHKNVWRDGWRDRWMGGQVDGQRDGLLKARRKGHTAHLSYACQGQM